ncbi:MAG TPA: hypothetical protein VLY63_17145, partial [Anaerolineae bacterium]|nr:hypothetical protein [Anaerolineae bacterium]
MGVLSKVGELLSTPQGSLVYYLLVLWAVMAGFGLALGEWRRARSERARRLLMAMGGLLLVRTVYAVGALVTSLGWINPKILLPPFEWFVNTVSIGLLVWAFMPRSNHRARTWNWLLGANLALAVAVCSVFTILWGQAWTGDSSLNYNAFWQATVWTVWQLALVLIVGFAAIRSRGEG